MGKGRQIRACLERIVQTLTLRKLWDQHANIDAYPFLMLVLNICFL